MIVRQIDQLSPDQETLEYAAKMIEAGAIIVFPSDSSYGLATNPHNSEATKRLFKVKERPYEKNISCVFRSIEQFGLWAEVGPTQQRILERNLPGPFTFILKARVACPLEGDSIGVRIPDSSLTKALAHVLDIPFTATSANRSGLEPAYSLSDIYQQFDGQIFQPDLILDAGKLPQYPASAVIDIRGKKPLTLREGVARIR